MRKGQIVLVEFSAKCPMKTSKFYPDLFGWITDFMEDMDYVSFDGGDGPG
jgi:predicted enzyme related to lactoylglutathione lyase